MPTYGADPVLGEVDEGTPVVETAVMSEDAERWRRALHHTTGPWGEAALDHGESETHASQFCTGLFLGTLVLPC